MARQYTRVALKIAAIYALTGCLWIVFSDRSVGLFTSDPAMITRISIAKGWVYVLLTAMLLYWLIQRHIDEVRLSVEKLTASEEKFSVAFSHSPVLMTISSIDNGSYLEVNESFCQVSGFSRQEAIGKTSVAIGWISAVDRERMVTVLRRDGRVSDMEINLTAKGGRTVNCLCSAVLITIEGEQHLLAIAQDITERKQNLEALHYANECFHQALNARRHILYRLNVKKGGYDYISPAFERITGYRVAEFENTGLEKLQEYFHTDDRIRIFAA
ncbi:MAG: multi-sensor hybrid histidine kinase, partial [Deltaproteobacteria bacterium]|nr:multi-sensor hybrid histidine kinase [Deltaproteobacteria bacterium]